MKKNLFSFYIIYALFGLTSIFLFPAHEIAAQVLPGAATLISPSGSTWPQNPLYTWNAVSTAQSYLLWVNDSTNHRINTWYTPAQANCSSGTGTCQVQAGIPLAYGPGQWWIQTWNTAGYGPWSTGLSFTISSSLLTGYVAEVSAPGPFTLTSTNQDLLTLSVTPAAQGRLIVFAEVNECSLESTATAGSVGAAYAALAITVLGGGPIQPTAPLDYTTGPVIGLQAASSSNYLAYTSHSIAFSRNFGHVPGCTLTGESIKPITFSLTAATLHPTTGTIACYGVLLRAILYSDETRMCPQ